MITLKIDKSVQCGEEYSVFVSFPYSMEIVNLIRSLPTRYWDKENTRWEVPFRRLDALIEMFADKYEVEIICDDPTCFKDKTEIDIPSGFEFKTKPFSHQVDGFKFGLNHNRWLLGDEMGLGKALALDTKVFTPNGYKLMRDIQVGDYVFGKNGKPTKVIATYNHSNVEM